MTFDASAKHSSRRLLIISPVFERGAGYRYRIKQYLPVLVAAGIEPTIRPFYSDRFMQMVYQPGHSVMKALQFFGRALGRLAQLFYLGTFDGVFIYREALPIGPPAWEWVCAKLWRIPIVFDFDDAVFLGDTSNSNRFMHRWKCPWKAGQIMRWSGSVIAGNAYLAGWAREHQRQVTIIPTAIDTARYQTRSWGGEPGTPVVGWIGTPTTVKYLESYAAVFQQLAERRQFRLKIVSAGKRVKMDGVSIEQVEWNLEREIEEFQSCDIGVAPLWDDAWSRGKCGFKALQFMACGVPVVASRVGVHNEMIESGVNGVLAQSAQEWLSAMEWLLDDLAARRRLGAAGRKTVEDRYSVAVNAPKFLAAVRLLWAKPAAVKAVADVSERVTEIPCAASAAS